MTIRNYVVATVKPWNVELFHTRHSDLPGNWHLIQSRDELSVEKLRGLNPRYIFFPHWSWNVPQSILEICECVCFHMTDLPFGRGGSPMQNLIVRGIKETKLTALRMEADLDTGPVYMKLPLKLDGSAEQIFLRAAILTWDIISEMISTEPESLPQIGEPENFQRRTPEESALPQAATLNEMFDHIRMLDAPTYPRAFLEYGNWRIDLFDAELSKDSITARVKITKIGEE